jgi:hypothetical protein
MGSIDPTHYNSVWTHQPIRGQAPRRRKIGRTAKEQRSVRKRPADRTVRSSVARKADVRKDRTIAARITILMARAAGKALRALEPAHALTGADAHSRAGPLAP